MNKQLARNWATGVAWVGGILTVMAFWVGGYYLDLEQSLRWSGTTYEWDIALGFGAALPVALLTIFAFGVFQVLGSDAGEQNQSPYNAPGGVPVKKPNDPYEGMTPEERSKAIGEEQRKRQEAMRQAIRQSPTN